MDRINISPERSRVATGSLSYPLVRDFSRYEIPNMEVLACTFQAAQNMFCRYWEVRGVDELMTMWNTKVQARAEFQQELALDRNRPLPGSGDLGTYLTHRSTRWRTNNIFTFKQIVYSDTQMIYLFATAYIALMKTGRWSGVALNEAQYRRYDRMIQ